MLSNSTTPDFISADGKVYPCVAVILVHWLNLSDTLECIASLERVNYPSLKIFVVNNGSPDFDEQQVHKTFPAVRIVNAEKNLGFAGGNNLGIAQAMQEEADLLFLLNNDTVVEPEIIHELLPALQEPGVGIVGPIITYYDEPNKVWFSAGSYSRLLGYSYRRRPLLLNSPDRPADFINGCALLAKREVFETIGLMWDELFLYFEEVELCQRAARAGYHCRLVGKPLVRHKVSASSGTRGSDYLTPQKAYYFGRNPLLLLRRNGRGIWKLTGLLSQFAVVLPFYFLQSGRAGNLKVLKHYLIGMKHGFQGRVGKRN